MQVNFTSIQVLFSLIISLVIDWLDWFAVSGRTNIETDKFFSWIRRSLASKPSGILDNITRSHSELSATFKKRSSRSRRDETRRDGRFYFCEEKILSLFEQWSSQFVGSSDNNDQNVSSSVVAANEQTQFNAEHCLSLWPNQRPVMTSFDIH